MSVTRLRSGSKTDTEWLFQLFKQTSKEFVEATWGWDELLQREAFFTNLPGDQFQILEQDGEPIGGYHLATKNDHLWLELLLVAGERQRQGFGSRMMEEIKARAMSSQLPIRLSVLRINPALQFYLAQSFREIDSDENSRKLVWSPYEASSGS